MLKESTCFSNNGRKESRERMSLSNSRLQPVEELTLGLKQKLHLQARARAAPYCIRKPAEEAYLVDRLLEEKALVAEAVRRLQALQQQCSDEEPKSKKQFAVDS